MESDSPSSPALISDARSLSRAASGLRCLPFSRAFYALVQGEAISSEALCQRSDWRRFCFVSMGPDRVEEHFLWLIKLGVLRREVDGQGLTERVRLTPMGRELVAGWPGEIPRAGLAERIHQNLRRHRPRL